MGSPSSAIPLPRNWADHVKSAFLQALGMAHMAMAQVRGRCTDSVAANADNERLRSEVELLREELRIKDARMARLPARHRPRYSPTDRLAILQLKASRGWNEQQAATGFLISAATIAGWLRRVDEKGTESLVRAPRPVNRYPDFVDHLVQRLKLSFPAMGKVRIAQLLGRAGLLLAVSTVGRMVKRSSSTPPPPTSEPGPEASSAGVVRTVTAKYPGHVWNVDLTTVPISGGFWVPWIPRALAQSWPFCWWVGFILDHFSRRVVGFSVFAKEPSAEQVCHMLDRAVERVGRAPKYTVTDQGLQFSGRYLQWCERHSVKPQYGAVGQHGSLAVIERFFLTLKIEAMRVIMVPFNLAAMRAELLAFVQWYDAHRAHQSFGGRTPAEVYKGLGHSDQRATKTSAGLFSSGKPLALKVSYLEGRKHLPLVELSAAA
jgi:transposase InsO family protein